MGKPGVLQSSGSQRVRHNLATEQQQQMKLLYTFIIPYWSVYGENHRGLREKERGRGGLGGWLPFLGGHGFWNQIVVNQLTS